MGATAARRWGAGLAGIAVAVASLVAVGGGGAAPAAATPGVRSAETLPPGFTDTVVGTMDRPIALAPTPDGRMLVVDQSGLVRVIEDGTLLSTPALDISAKVCAENSEQGMLGIAVDPKFAQNGFVYLYYTFRKFPKCQRFTDVPVNRISRFTMVGDTIDPASEKILVDEMLSYHGNHNAGDLGFGKDGMLYASVGDGGCDYTVTGKNQCDPANTIAQKTFTLQGKVLRITPKGGIPKDNPFTGTGTARCNHGAIAPGLTCREIYMYGFRNPFRFAFDPNSPTTRMYVNDVGEITWEEVDLAQAGANYGWNVREGFCANGSTTDCGPPPPGMTNPIFAYSHVDTGCAAITGGAFVPNGAWGGAYDGGYLFSDYVCRKIFLMTPAGGGGYTASAFATGITKGGPIALQFAPHGSKTSLYYTTYTGNVSHGQIRVIDQS